MLSVRHRFIFVHIPKTGGDAVNTALAPFSEDTFGQGGVHNGMPDMFVRVRGSQALHKHSSLRDIRSEFGDRVAGFHVLATVRNAWDRARSHFVYETPLHRPDWAPERFLRWLLGGSDFRTMGSFVADCAGGAFGGVDTYLRFENLSQDFAAVTSRLGLLDVMPLPAVNVTPHRRGDWVWTLDMIAAVAHVCRREIEYFKMTPPDEG